MELTNTQKSIMKKLREDTGVENLSLDPKATVAAADARYSASSMRVALSTLRKVYPDTKFFVEEMARRKPIWEGIDTAQAPTERQAAQFIKWDDLLKWRDANWDTLDEQERLLLGLYTMMPPVRLDWTPMKLVRTKPRKTEEGYNYLIVRPSSMDVLFTAYKTAHKYGPKQFKIPARLQRTIRDYLAEHKDNQFLLQDDAGLPWTEQRLGASVRRIFQHHHQMDTGVSMLRHSYATKYHAGQRPLKELKGTAEKMLHSPMMSQTYRFLELE